MTTSESRVALVTGGGSGIGAACARRLAEHGYAVAVAGRRYRPLADLASCFQSGSGTVFPIQSDVSDETSVSKLFTAIIQRWGRLDFLFNNAGCSAATRPIEELSFGDWKRVVDVNLTGTFLCTQHAVRLMKRQQPSGGRILNNGSLSAHVPRPHSAAYTATKHAISGLTKSTALDCRGSGICCGQIDIGNVATNMTERMGQGVLQPDGSIRLEPRIGVEAVADAVLYMADLPLDVGVPNLTVMANEMPYLGRG